VLQLLPKNGMVVERPKPISVPIDGTVYDPELAHCCSCEPERAAAGTAPRLQSTGLVGQLQSHFLSRIKVRCRSGPKAMSWSEIQELPEDV